MAAKGTEPEGSGYRGKYESGHKDGGGGVSQRDRNRGTKPKVFSMRGQVRREQSEGTSKRDRTEG